MAKDPRSRPWKRTFREIPQTVRAALSRISEDFVVVAATKVIPFSAVADGIYHHLGLTGDGGTPVAGPPAIPPADGGRFSNNNVYGWEVIRRDLPMIVKTYTWETPNFGDAATYGAHMHYQDREVYQREYFEPRNLSISVEILNQRASGASALVKFSIGDVLDRTRADFEQDLFSYLSLLQENAGVCGVYASTAIRADFIGTIALDWEVFPPGTAAEVIAALTKGRSVRSGRAGVVEERVELLASLKPTAFLRGTGSFGSYVGAQFSTDLVVFENVTYGNALYVLYDQWVDVSKRSRLDLLKGTTKNFDRFLHTEGWEDRFNEHMRIELEKRTRSRR